MATRRTPARTRIQRYPKWTDEEDQILIDEIGKNPLNLRMCFISASTIMRRTPTACASRWYGKISKKEEKEYTGVITMGKHVAFRNRKRFKEGMPTIALANGFFQRVVDALFDLIGHE